MSHDPHVSGAHAEQGDSTPFGGTRLLTILDVAEFLQVKPKKVYGLPIPKVYVSDRRVRYLESDVLAYVRSHRSNT